MEETSVNKLPFPETTDSPDGPTQIGDLAEALDVLKWGSRNLKPTVGIKRCSADLALTEAFQDVVMAGGNLEITPDVASNLLVFAQFMLTPHAGDTFKGRIMVDAEAREAVEFIEIEEALTRVPLPLFDVIPLSAAKHTIKLQAQDVPAIGGTKVRKSATWFAYMLVAS